MTLTEIEQSVKKLSPDQLRAFRAWYVNFDSKAWDTEIEQDALSGKLDSLAEIAIKEHKRGRTQAL